LQLIKVDGLISNMRILAVDTSTTSCSVAIVDETSLLSEFTIDREETHSRHLMDMIKAVMTMAGLYFSDLDGFAVTRGPGTFTGLRIGISTIKGLAVASEKPVVGISSLETLAFQGSFSRDLICPILDARKGEVYFSRYRFLNGHLKRQTKERVAPPDKAVDDLNESCLFVGNGALLYKEMILEKMGEFASFAPMIQNTIRASTIAYLSMAKFENNDTDEIEKILPYYIRKSDAELNLVI
jgi:tRNA threonylcarbamoyladenosine biosynthesis protein TsaB